MNEIDAIRFKLSKAKNLDDVIECCKDWAVVLRRKMKIKPRSYQIPLADKMIEYRVSEASRGNEIVTLWARQSGKTETVSDTVLILGTFYIIFLDEDFNCGLFAPVKSMITHVTRNRLRKRYDSVRVWLRDQAGIIQTAGEGITSSLFILKSLITNKELYIQSLSVGERAEIIGATFSLMIIEQSELVNSMKLKNDVFPMGAEKGGVRVMTGTTSPYFKNEYFKQAVDRWSEDPSKNTSTADYVECIPWKIAAKESINYRRYVTREKNRMGEDSIEFKTQFGLQWVGVKLKFIGFEDLALLEMDYIWCRERMRFFGIDVAQAGDSTVVTVIEIDGTDIHIIGWLELEGIDYEKQIEKIAAFLKRYKPLRFGFIDIVTLGKPVYDILKKRLRETDEETGKIRYWARLEGYHGSASENHEVNQAMDREFTHGRLHFSKHVSIQQRREKNRFIEQVLDLERKYTGKYLKLEHPDIKGRHDDFPKSLGYAIYAFKDKSFKCGIAHVRF